MDEDGGPVPPKRKGKRKAAVISVTSASDGEEEASGKRGKGGKGKARKKVVEVASGSESDSDGGGKKKKGRKSSGGGGAGAKKRRKGAGPSQLEVQRNIVDLGDENESGEEGPVTRRSKRGNPVVLNCWKLESGTAYEHSTFKDTGKYSCKLCDKAGTKTERSYKEHDYTNLKSHTDMCPHRDQAQNFDPPLELPAQSKGAKAKAEAAARRAASANTGAFDAFREAGKKGKKVEILNARPELVADTLVRWQVRHDHEDTVQEQGLLRQAFEQANPAVQLLGRTMVGNKAKNLYKLLRLEAREATQRLRGLKHTESDCWTSRGTMFAIMATLVHGVDSAWERRCYLLRASVMEEDHTGQNIARRHAQALKDSVIIDDHGVWAHDSASNNIASLPYLSEHIRRESPSKRLWLPDDNDNPCTAHVINLAGQDLLSAFGLGPSSDQRDLYIEDRDAGEPGLEDGEENDLEDPEVDGMELDGEEEEEDMSDAGSVAGDDAGESEEPGEFTANPTFLSARQKILKLSKKIRSTAKQKAKYRAVASDTLSPEDSKLLPLKHNKTRWHSERNVFRKALRIRKGLHKFFTSQYDVYRDYILTDEEWHELELLVELLDVFWSATMQLQYAEACLGDVLPIYQSLMNDLKKFSKDPRFVSLGSAIEAAMAKLEKYFGPARRRKCNIIATALHPAFCFVFFKNSFSPEEANKAEAVVRQELVRRKQAQAPTTGAVETASSAASSAPSSSAVKLAGKPSKPRHMNLNLGARVEPLDELTSYIHASPFEGYECPLKWWKAHASTNLATLAEMARDYLGAPAAAVSVERFFSWARHISTEKRGSLTSKRLKETMSSKAWMMQGLTTDKIL